MSGAAQRRLSEADVALGIARPTRAARAATWWVSAAATVVSTYALDLVTASTGLLGVASGALNDLAAPGLLPALAS